MRVAVVVVDPWIGLTDSVQSSSIEDDNENEEGFGEVAAATDVTILELEGL